MRNSVLFLIVATLGLSTAQAQDDGGTLSRIAVSGEFNVGYVPDAPPMSFDPMSLTFNDAGLIPAIAQDVDSNEVLMLAWMNAQSITQTLETQRVTYWSRSRQTFWVKGDTSGHVQELVEFRFDCDRDCLLVLVRQTGPACHTGRRSCFYTSVEDGVEVELTKPL